MREIIINVAAEKDAGLIWTVVADTDCMRFAGNTRVADIDIVTAVSKIVAGDIA